MDVGHGEKSPKNKVLKNKVLKDAVLKSAVLKSAADVPDEADGADADRVGKVVGPVVKAGPVADLVDPEDPVDKVADQADLEDKAVAVDVVARK